MTNSRRVTSGFDVDDLIPTFVTSADDISFAEQANIESAALWAFGRRRVVADEEMLTIRFSDGLHRRMFGDVWRSAGSWSARTTPTGVPADDIEERLDDLFVELRLRHDRGIGSPSERAAAICSGLVHVSAYRHGNVRHARFMAELYLHQIGAPKLVWSEVVVDLPDLAISHGDPSLSALRAALDRVTQSDPKRLQSALDRAVRRRS